MTKPRQRQRRVQPAERTVRFFASVSGFSDDTLYIRLEKTGGVWDGTTVLKDGSEKPAALRGIEWCLENVKAGTWREISEPEAAALGPCEASR